MTPIKLVLKTKSVKTIYSVPPEISVFDAIQLMCLKDISSLLITQDEKLLGIFTERDYIRKLILKGKHSNDTSICEVMTADPITVSPENTVDECMRLMTKNRIRHLPVLDQDNLIGVISIGDLVHQVIDDQNKKIGFLEDYIKHT